MTNRITGIGYQANRIQRIKQGFSGNLMEAAGYERYLIYFGRAHITDHETDLTSRGFMKVGRGKFATALQRGRNQPGVDFRIYGEIILASNEATHAVEKLVSKKLLHKHMTFSQGQSEMYDINDNELEKILKDVAQLAKSNRWQVNEVNLYDNDKKIPLDIEVIV